MNTEQLNAIISLIGYFEGRVEDFAEDQDTGTITLTWRKSWGDPLVAVLDKRGQFDN